MHLPRVSTFGYALGVFQDDPAFLVGVQALQQPGHGAAFAPAVLCERGQLHVP